MKKIIFILVLYATQNAYASAYDAATLKTFLTKKQICYLAAGMPNIGPTSKTATLSNNVLCITDATANEGTIKEVSGCGFVLYDVESDRIKTTHFSGGYGEDPSKTKGYSIAIVPNKKCDAGGFEELLKVFPGAAYGETVEAALFEGLVKSAGTQLVYTAESKYESWWKAAKAKHDSASVAAHKTRPIADIEFEIEDSIRQRCSNLEQVGEDDSKERDKNLKAEAEKYNQIRLKLLEEYSQRGGKKKFLNKCHNRH